MHIDLTGKVALVTGGSRGIGAASARALAAAGADVVVSHSNSAEAAETVVQEIRSLGRRGEAIRADQADRAAVDALVRGVADRFGRLDILVNNAGVFVTGPVGDTTDEDHVRQFAVNVDGVFAAVRAAAGVMSDGGRIISIGSVLGDRSPFPGGGGYSAAKAAVAHNAGGCADGREHAIHVHRELADMVLVGGVGSGRIPRLAAGLLYHGYDPGRGRRLQRVSNAFANSGRLTCAPTRKPAAPHASRSARERL
jgi:NAD(P)-dependent dehydrogenase (short-subunit alcohol dehydrogenase family)